MLCSPLRPAAAALSSPHRAPALLPRCRRAALHLWTSHVWSGALRGSCWPPGPRTMQCGSLDGKVRFVSFFILWEGGLWMRCGCGRPSRARLRAPLLPGPFGGQPLRCCQPCLTAASRALPRGPPRRRAAVDAAGAPRHGDGGQVEPQGRPAALRCCPHASISPLLARPPPSAVSPACLRAPALPASVSIRCPHHKPRPAPVLPPCCCVSPTELALCPFPWRRLAGRHPDRVGRQGGVAEQAVHVPLSFRSGLRLAQQHHVCLLLPGRLHRSLQAVRRQAAAALAGTVVAATGGLRYQPLHRRARLHGPSANTAI